MCLVGLAKRPNRHADNDLVDSLGLAGVTGDSYSLIEMKTGAVANNLALVEYNFALINADHGPQLIVEELVPAVFDIFRESDPVADRERDLLPLKHAKIPCLFEWQLLLDAILSDDNSSLLTAKDFPLFAAFKALFSELLCEQLPWQSYETRQSVLAHR